MAHGTISSKPFLGYQSAEDQTDYLIGVITHLEAISARKLDQLQAQSWMEKLKRYPKWKVSELGDYSGPMNHKVFEYLDALQAKPEDPYSDLGYYNKNQIPEEPESFASQRIQIARDFLAHVEKFGQIGSMAALSEEEKKQKRQAEWESYKELDRKYPHLHVLEQVKNEKRFKEVSRQ